MRWLLDVAYIALGASYKWLLGIIAVVGILVGALFAAGVLGGDSSENGEPRVIPTRVPAQPRTPIPTTAPVVSTPTLEPTATAPAKPVPLATPTTAAPVVAERAQVAIMLQGAADVGSLEFVLKYDPAVLEAGLVEPGLLLGPGALIDSSTEIPGAVGVAMADVSGITGDGPVAIITFTIVGSGDAATPLDLEGVATFGATSLVDIITDATPGRFTVADGVVTPPTLSFVP